MSHLRLPTGAALALYPSRFRLALILILALIQEARDARSRMRARFS